MIKLFRNIRQKLLAEGKTSNYLKYAIGEIVLVVIGILIALQINNWNENRKNEEKITTILEEIQKDLSDDVLDANRVFDTYITKDSLKKLFLENKLPKNKSGFIYFYENFTIHNNGYVNLTQSSSSIPKKYTDIYNDLNNLYSNIAKDIPVYNERIQRTVYNNVDYIAKNKEWYWDWVQNIGNPEIEKFYKTDFQYRNGVGIYMVDLTNVTRSSNFYKVKAVEVYQKIETLLGNKKPIPERMNLHLKDTTLLKQIEGNYIFQEGPSNFKDKTNVIKVIDGSLFIGISNKKESDFTKLSWYKNTCFFISSTIFNFNIENGKTILKITAFAGTSIWTKIK